MTAERDALKAEVAALMGAVDDAQAQAAALAGALETCYTAATTADQAYALEAQRRAALAAYRSGGGK